MTARGDPDLPAGTAGNKAAAGRHRRLVIVPIGYATLAFGFILVLALAVMAGTIAPSPVRTAGGPDGPADPDDPDETRGDWPFWSRPLPWIQSALPVHRSILAVDIERSTMRTNPVKEELRQQVYRLLMRALDMTGIAGQHLDPFTDLGDGVLILVHPVDDIPKPLLLSRLIPALAGLLRRYNCGIPDSQHPRLLRLRAVVHAGEVHCDDKGFFGEDLDVACRLLDAPRFKKHLQEVAAPLALVVSEEIYRSVVRHCYDGIDGDEYSPLVSVTVGDRRRRGWVHVPGAA